MTELHEHTALDQYRLLQAGEVSPTELAAHYLGRVERLNTEVGAFATVTPELAIARAGVVERDVPRSRPLWGLPLADKDLQLRAGVPAEFGSRAFADFVPDESDELVRAVDAAGAVSLGKTATPEFGLPSYTEGLAFPPARNPWNLELGAGGSSGGAAAAVAAGMLPFAPGSDGGGSIRIPAAACGLVGVKPSRGRVPAGPGLASLAGLGVAGPIARTVADAALLLDGLIAPLGYPAAHRYALRAPGDDGPFLGAAIRGEGRYQLGVMTDSPWDDWVEISIEAPAIAALDQAIGVLDGMGHGIERVPASPEPGYADAFRTVWQAGAATIPVDGDREALLEPLTRWLVERGRTVPARQLAEALSWLTGFEERVIRRFASFDAIVTPALALTPRPVGWYDAVDGERNFAQQVQFTPFTSFVNVSGLPAITVPVAETDDGVPLGVQLIGRPGGEGVLFSIAAQLERRSGRSTRHPALWAS
ncbi:amidase [Agromyces sp. S2-1-8]|uniref:amidase n=1 Tax=Agromyces sp. S2-1-8 TaxID=2897180 RepID=UPI001E47BDFF|nr:amidase [Agromyces sp. S2-1-8]MCD5347689.1 amidase [Agromyces sp. S2-1-8]